MKIVWLLPLWSEELVRDGHQVIVRNGRIGSGFSDAEYKMSHHDA